MVDSKDCTPRFCLSSRLSAAHGEIPFVISSAVERSALPLGSSKKSQTPFTTHSTPSSPTLSQSHSLVATTSTRIRLFSWNQPKIPVPLQPVKDHTLVVFSYIYFGYWLVIKYKGFTVMRAPLLILFLFIQKSNIFKTRKKEV